jgi:8-oxo-dGTP pyrophosphatase MutT (NUDIX family)
MDRHFLNPSRIEQALRVRPGGSSDFDLNPGFRPPAGRPLRPASVLVPLVERNGRMRLILTRRAALLRHHPGQVAFPGGKQDVDDATPLAAALREAREEIGLGEALILGELDSHETVTEFRVTPFVGLVPADFVPVIDRREVDEVFEVPLDFVLNPANYRIESRRWQGHDRRYFVVPYGPHYIWGATARMLRTFADRMQAA